MSITRKEALEASEQAYGERYQDSRGRPALGLWNEAFCRGVEWTQSVAFTENPAAEPMRLPPSFAFDAPGYEELADVLLRAFHQAASGKGKERHAQGEPFTEQVMQDMARRFGVGSLLGQAFKKSEESQRLPHDRAVAELLGAINYLAGAVIALEARQAEKAANDNNAHAYGTIAGFHHPV